MLKLYDSCYCSPVNRQLIAIQNLTIFDTDNYNVCCCGKLIRSKHFAGSITVSAVAIMLP